MGIFASHLPNSDSYFSLQKPMQDALRNTILEFFQTLPHVAAVYLFGSQTTPEKTNRHSDIDLAVLFVPEHLPAPIEFLEIKDNLSDKIGQNLDMVNLNDCNPIVAMQVLEKGIPLKIYIPTHVNQWTTKIITQYADLKLLRKPIEAQFLEDLTNG